MHTPAGMFTAHSRFGFRTSVSQKHSGALFVRSTLFHNYPDKKIIKVRGPERSRYEETTLRFEKCLVTKLRFLTPLS